MRLTKDAKELSEKYRAAFEHERDFSDITKRDDIYALVNEAGFSIFRREYKGLYSFIVGTDPAHRGKHAKDMINDSFSWMFINTDAYVLSSTIDKTNLASLSISIHTLGYRLYDTPDPCPVKLFKSTLVRWAKEYGLEKALSEIRAARQFEKADKLEAAAKAAGLL